MRPTLHAGCVAVHGAGGWRGVLIRGPSGAGKSDLALRLAARPGWRLVADDRCHVWASGGALWARAPERISGLIEARGLGIVTAPRRPLARLVLALDLVEAAPERLPEPEIERLQGVSLRRLALDPRPASAVELVAAAMAML